MSLKKYFFFLTIFLLIKLESLPKKIKNLLIELNLLPDQRATYAKTLKSLFFAELGLFYESDQYRKITNFNDRYRERIKFTCDFVEKEKKRHPLAPAAFELIESDLFFCQKRDH